MELLSAKVLAIALALATTAFCVSTIVLAVQKADLEDELQDALVKLDAMATSTASPTTNTPSPSPIPTPTPTLPIISTNPPISTETPDPGTPTPPTEIPTPPIESTPPTPPTPPAPPPTLTTPAETPTQPTLPPGLTDPEEILYRLPNDIRPIKYNIYYYPHLSERTFDADISIQIEIDKSTNLIPMHSKNLEIGSISILNMMGRMRVRVKRTYTDDIRELLIIELEEMLFTSTPYVVSISYEGSLDGLTGMYASSYFNEKGEERAANLIAFNHNLASAFIL